jgi:hypothetical protein
MRSGIMNDAIEMNFFMGSRFVRADLTFNRQTSWHDHWVI